MRDGFYPVAALTPPQTPGQPMSNAKAALDMLCGVPKARLAVFPELFLTGCRLGALFLRPELLRAAEEGLVHFLEESKSHPALIAIGLPWLYQGRLYNAAAVCHRGTLLGIVPKAHLNLHAPWKEGQCYASGADVAGRLIWDGRELPFGTDVCFEDGNGLCAAFAIGGDLAMPDMLCRQALVLGHLSAWEDGAGAGCREAEAVRFASSQLCAGAVHASAGEGDGGGGLLFTGGRIAAENGHILARSATEAWSGVTATEIDIALLAYERRRLGLGGGTCRRVSFAEELTMTVLTRKYVKKPFVPVEAEPRAKRCEELFRLQTRALRTRLERCGAKCAVVALSGGLDSALALLAARGTGFPVQALTMPGPGTTERTRRNAEILCEAWDISLYTIPIREALAQHLKDIGHDGTPDVFYENAQARERTQIAMDRANMAGGLMVGTPDLSELALGFSTYGGDHMSMFHVNSGLPKSLIRCIVRHLAMREDSVAARGALLDILDTPVSPELLPLEEGGEQRQQTESILGDYNVHDFYLYWMVRYGFSREKLWRTACRAFAGVYDGERLRAMLDVFWERFRLSQFKRACSPDGVRMGSVSLAPGDWEMPSDLGVLL